MFVRAWYTSMAFLPPLTGIGGFSDLRFKKSTPLVRNLEPVVSYIIPIL